ncbi:preprotein translocase subunit YajC [Chloroflexota bacterium]
MEFSTIGFFAIFIILFGAMVYFLMIRPIRQREKKHDQLIDYLQKGNKVITAGGMYGQIESIDEDSVVLKVESGAMVRVAKGGILKTEDEE